MENKPKILFLICVGCNSDAASWHNVNCLALCLRCENRNGTGDLPTPLYCQNLIANTLATANKALGRQATAIDP